MRVVNLKNSRNNLKTAAPRHAPPELPSSLSSAKGLAHPGPRPRSRGAGRVEPQSGASSTAKGAAPDLEEVVRQMLVHLGENPKREGLLKTPGRVARSLRELTEGYQMDIEAILNRAFFKEVAYSEMVLVRDITFYSICEHHLLPFFGKAHVAYIPDKVIVGLSKIPKVVHCLSKRLQVQEQLTSQIAEIFNDKLKPLGVGVVLEARHLCMEMRGAKSVLSPTITSEMLGSFKEDARTRSEFLTLIHGR